MLEFDDRDKKCNLGQLEGRTVWDFRALEETGGELGGATAATLGSTTLGLQPLCATIQWG